MLWQIWEALLKALGAQEVFKPVSKCAHICFGKIRPPYCVHSVLEFGGRDSSWHFGSCDSRGKPHSVVVAVERRSQIGGQFHSLVGQWLMANRMGWLRAVSVWDLGARFESMVCDGISWDWAHGEWAVILWWFEDKTKPSDFTDLR